MSTYTSRHLADWSYFYPRLSAGGIIITDDYGTPRYPGARKAWGKFCTAGQYLYSVFETGQAAIIRSYEIYMREFASICLE